MQLTLSCRRFIWVKFKYTSNPPLCTTWQKKTVSSTHIWTPFLPFVVLFPSELACLSRMILCFRITHILQHKCETMATSICVLRNERKRFWVVVGRPRPIEIATSTCTTCYVEQLSTRKLQIKPRDSETLQTIPKSSKKVQTWRQHCRRVKQQVPTAEVLLMVNVE